MTAHHQGWLAHTATDEPRLVTIVSDDDDLVLIEHPDHQDPEWVPRSHVSPAEPFRATPDTGHHPGPGASVVKPDGPYPTRDHEMLSLHDRVETTGAGHPAHIITGTGAGHVMGFTTNSGILHVWVSNETDAARTLIPLAQLRKA